MVAEMFWRGDALQLLVKSATVLIFNMRPSVQKLEMTQKWTL